MTTTLPAGWMPRLSCPFCGSNCLFTEPDEVGSGGQWVSPIHVGCNDCKAEQVGDTEDEAVSRWNARSTPPASAQDDAKDEKPYCYALETRGEHNGIADVLLDVEYNGADSFSHGRKGGFPLYRRPAPAAGDARDAALRGILHSIRQARIVGNDWRRELALIENTAAAALSASQQQEG